MLGTLMRRVTVRTLDSVVSRGKQSERTPVRFAASALDKARSVVGLNLVAREAPLPSWEGAHPERPMWDSDRKKMGKYQVDQGITPAQAETAESEAEEAPTLDAADGAPIKVFYKRGCPYARAAIDLLREREIPFEETDIKGDDATTSWLKIVTGASTTPQIFIKGEAIGGYDELRVLDLDGKLREFVTTEDQANAPKRVSLNVLHPERSPFEDLLDDFNGPTEVLEGEELVARVREVLDECRPMVQADGGDIELLDVASEIVHLRLTGNCVGCPSAQATLRQGIERRLKSRIPQLRGIESPQLQ